MIMKYTLQYEDKKSIIYEHQTEQVVGVFTSHKEAAPLYRRMSRGGVFDGWTPQFFLVKVKK